MEKKKPENQQPAHTRGKLRMFERIYFFFFPKSKNLGNEPRTTRTGRTTQRNQQTNTTLKPHTKPHTKTTIWQAWQRLGSRWREDRVASESHWLCLAVRYLVGILSLRHDAKLVLGT